jgi:hypothetical protein
MTAFDNATPLITGATSASLPGRVELSPEPEQGC